MAFGQDPARVYVCPARSRSAAGARDDFRRRQVIASPSGPEISNLQFWNVQSPIKINYWKFQNWKFQIGDLVIPAVRGLLLPCAPFTCGIVVWVRSFLRR